MYAHATPHRTHNNRQPQFLSNPRFYMYIHKPFVMGTNGRKKIRMGVLKRQTTEDQGSANILTPPQEISLIDSLFLIYTPSSISP